MISLRTAGNGVTYLRVSNFVLPFYGFVPTGGLTGNPKGYTIHAHVPVNDVHSLRFNILYRRNRAVTDAERRLDEEFSSDFTKVRNIRNDYLIDRDEQRHETFVGLGRNFVIHDSCATESTGPRYDRSREHLGVGDITVIGLRRRLLEIVRSLDTGIEPPHLIRTPEQNDMRHVACIVTRISSSIDPKQYLAESLKKENIGTTCRRDPDTHGDRNLSEQLLDLQTMTPLPLSAA